jgi:hypothetical protein
MRCSACVSFDHLAGGGEQRLRDLETERLGGLFPGSEASMANETCAECSVIPRHAVIGGNVRRSKGTGVPDTFVDAVAVLGHTLSRRGDRGHRRKDQDRGERSHDQFFHGVVSKVVLQGRPTCQAPESYAWVGELITFDLRERVLPKTL